MAWGDEPSILFGRNLLLWGRDPGRAQVLAHGMLQPASREIQSSELYFGGEVGRWGGEKNSYL